MTGNNHMGFLYYICDLNTDLPAYIADTAEQAMSFLGCSRKTLYRMINTGSSFSGYMCFKLRDL